MKLKDKLFDPHSRRYWALIKFVEFIAPTGFTLCSLEDIRDYNTMIPFIFRNQERAEAFRIFQEELKLEIMNYEIDSIFEEIE